MPSAVGMTPHLAAYVHALLVETGLIKTAKKFEAEFEGQVRCPDPTLRSLAFSLLR